MSEVDFITQTSPWLQKPSFRYDIIQRDQYSVKNLKESSRLVRILLGARRVGKTSILYSYINELLDTTSPHKIFFIPGDLPEVKSTGIKKTIDQLAATFHFDMFKQEVFFFIDEVQEVKNWQNDIKLLYDHTKAKFFLSGSSSLLLKKETAKLTGRFLLQNVLPLSYPEFILFSKKSHHPYSLEDYLKIGGYPEYVINRNPQYLQQAAESTLYRELLDVYGIRNPRLLTDILHLLADKITTSVSARNIAATLNIDDKTAGFYLDYLQSIYLIYPLYRFGKSNKITKSSVPKYYFNDTGILNLYGIRPREGHLYENAVFLQLLRAQSSTEVPKISYDNIDQQEIDFRVGTQFYEVKANMLTDDAQIAKYADVGLEKVALIVKDMPNKKLFRSGVEFVKLEKFLLAEKLP